jgi:hypothetical protein
MILNDHFSTKVNADKEKKYIVRLKNRCSFHSDLLILIIINHPLEVPISI